MGSGEVLTSARLVHDTVILRLLVVVPATLSVTRTVNVLTPVVVGVPEITPPLDKVRPAGRLPLASDQVYGGVPPCALTVTEYATPSVAAGSGEVVVIVSAGTIVRLNCPLTDCGVGEQLSVAVTVMLNVPFAEGVPVSNPPELRLIPVGSDPDVTAHVIGAMPPVEVNWNAV